MDNRIEPGQQDGRGYRNHPGHHGQHGPGGHPHSGQYDGHRDGHRTHYYPGQQNQYRGHPGQTGYLGAEERRDYIPQAGYSSPGRQGAPIMLQPMQQPSPIPGGLNGIESLASVDELAIHKDEEIYYRQFYNVLNTNGQPIGNICEEAVPSDACCSMICIPNRGFRVHALDSYGQHMFVLERNFKCCAGCCCCADGCCYFPVYVNDQNGRRMGMVRWMQTSCKPKFGIFDAEEQLLYTLTGHCEFCDVHVEFPIRNVKDDNTVGTLKGLAKTNYRLGNKYTLTFDTDLSVQHKALMIASVFVIDANLFERQMPKKNY